MPDRRLDVLFVNPNSARQAYQGLAQDFSAIEVPVWSLLLAEACRRKGFGVEVLDCDAERLNYSQAVSRILAANPRLVCFVVYGQNPNSGTTNMAGAAEILGLLAIAAPSLKVCFAGSYAQALPLEVLGMKGVSFVLLNEGVYALQWLLALDLDDLEEGVPHAMDGVGWKGKDGRVHLNKPERTVPQDRMANDLPGYSWDLLPKRKKPLDLYRSHFWHADFDFAKATPAAALYTSLGCPFKCLAGDTLINTVHGKIPIKELAESFDEVGVFTYDPVQKQARVCTARNIRRTGRGKKLVRVRFIDGSYIDCTPDHRFLRFKWGNQNVGYRMWETEAWNLRQGDHVQAIREEKWGAKGNEHWICWNRNGREKRYRMIAEWMIGRPLRKGEVVHHADRDHGNDDPSNLEVCSSQKDHISRHPEVAERMRNNNPTKNGFTVEWRGKSEEAKKRYCRAARKLRRGIISVIRKPENHVVDYVEELPGRHDVYCMEVPETGWFYANNVLVHNCDFCMINSINRDSNDPDWSAADSAKIRYFPWQHTLAQLAWLANNGVTTIRLSDEMFFLNKRHYIPLLENIKLLFGDSLRLWAYARVDTIKPDQLALFRSAGVRWLALGIETASRRIRREVSKGSYEEVDIRRVVKEIREAGISVIANYVFGLPDDDYGSMAETLNLSIELNTEMWNGYPAMALPGSPLYNLAREKRWPMPQSFEAYSFLGYECFPMPTKYLTPGEVLSFRDRAFQTYFSRPDYLSMVEAKFGKGAGENIQKLAAIKLKRRVLGD